MKLKIKAFFDEPTSTISYVVAEPKGDRCAIIDPVLDYDPKSGRTSTLAADLIIEFVRDTGLKVDWILETHAHADHLTSSAHLKENLGGLIAIGEHVTIVQQTFKKLFNLDDSFADDGSQFDHLFADGERFAIGGLSCEAMHTPGHTPACVSYVIGDSVFVGDTLFMPDFGTARCDFPGSDAATLYRSIQRLLSLPPETRLFMCHDYPPESRGPAWETTVSAERQHNIHVGAGVSEEQFVAVRNERDKSLELPLRILPSVQVNIRAGRFPPPEDNGVSYLKIPLNAV